MKDSAAAVGSCEQRGAADFLHPLAHDRETEPRATLTRREERFPNSFAQISGNTGARIFNRDHELIVMRISDELHVSTTRRRLQRIQQKVRHGVTQSRNALACEHRIRPDLAFKTDALLARIRLKQMHDRT